MFAVFAFCPIGTTVREKNIMGRKSISSAPMQGARQMPKAIWIFLFLAEMDFVSLRSSSVLCGIASSDRFFLFIRDLVLDQLEAGQFAYVFQEMVTFDNSMLSILKVNNPLLPRIGYSVWGLSIWKNT